MEIIEWCHLQILLTQEKGHNLAVHEPFDETSDLFRTMLSLDCTKDVLIYALSEPLSTDLIEGLHRQQDKISDVYDSVQKYSDIKHIQLKWHICYMLHKLMGAKVQRKMFSFEIFK